MNYGPLLYSDLTCRSHPLNRGRVSWWMAVPWYMSGPRFIDICGRNHGTLTNGPTWRGTTRPGGWGELSFDGTNDYVLCKSGGIIATLANSSVVAWVKPTAANRAIYCERLAGNAIWKMEVGNTNLKLTHRDDAGSLTQPGIAGPSLTDGAWHHVAITKLGTTVALYTDGRLMGSATLNGNDTLTVGETRIAGDAADGSAYLPGQIDSVAVFSRTLAASEVAIDYDLSRRGYPGVVNRMRRGYPAGIVDTIPDDFTNAKRYIFPPQQNEFAFPAQENEFTMPPQPSDFSFPPEL